MIQIAATFSKSFKGFLRLRPVLLGTVAWPIILLVVICSTSLSNVARADVPLAKGEVTIYMIVFSLMLAGIANLAGSIARDRENGLLAKLRSMPINAGTDFSGRFLALTVFALLAVALVTVVGLSLGARFQGTFSGSLEAVGFVLLIICAAAGIGLIIGSLVRTVQGASFTGVGITVITAFVSGVFISYSALPPVLQGFARFYPISSAGSAASYLVLGEDATGYNPLATGQIIITIVLALALLGAGAFLYSRLSWKRD
jgi:ABC-2 type transport system permease protein